MILSLQTAVDAVDAAVPAGPWAGDQVTIPPWAPSQGSEDSCLIADNEDQVLRWPLAGWHSVHLLRKDPTP